MELTNQTICPKCSQREDFTTIDLLPMKMIFFPYLNKYKMKCLRCGKAWDLPEGFNGNDGD